MKVSRTPKRVWVEYAMALFCVALGAGVRASLLGTLGNRAVFVTFYPAVILAGLYGGLGAGLFATVLSAAVADYFFIPPRGFGISDPADWLALVVFLISCTMISGISGAMRRAQAKVAAAEARASIDAERLRAAEQLASAAAETERQRQLLHVTLASIGDGVIVSDREGRVTFLNAEAQRLTGWNLAEAQGQLLPAIFKIINEHSRQSVESPVEKVLRLGTVVGLANHTILVARDGRETPIDDAGAPIKQGDGTVLGVVLVFRDFSKEKAAEKVLRESERRLRTFVESGIVGVIYWNTHGEVTEANDKFLEMVGYSREELASARVDWARMTPPEYQHLDEQSLAELKATGVNKEPFEKEYIRRDGTRIPILIAGAMLDEARLNGVAFVLDITGRKRAEEALQESEGRYRNLFEAMDEGFALCEMVYDEAGQAIDFRYLNVNPAFQKLTGLSAESVQGKRATVAIPGIESYWIERYGQVVRTGQSGRFAHEVAALGRQFEVYAYRAEPDRFAAVFMDVTERKRAEDELKAAKRSAEEARAVAETANKAKDHFLAVLSHELRTPLAPVVATVSMLQQDPRFDADTRENLEMIRRNVELEARLIDDLLDVTRIERGKVELDKQPVDLAVILRRAADVCMLDIKARKLEFGIDVPDGPYLVDADVARLQQVIWNLLKNAIKFTPVGGCVDIRCRRDGAGHVIAEVRDNGEGIAPEVLPRLFSAFEQGGRQVTRQFGGLGLGLAISIAIVQMHGGTLTAHSDGRGKGATFVVRLPLCGVQPPPEEKAGPAAAVQSKIDSSAPRRKLRILLVEDHGDTARAMGRLLRAKGHEVQIAADVATGLQSATQGTFDVILSDIGLPDGSGLDLIRAVRAKGITAPAIALSGYGQEKDLQASREAGFVIHLVKPVNMSRLKEAIATVTEANGG